MSVRDQGFGEAQPEWQGPRPGGAEQPQGDDDVLERLRKAVVDSATDARRAFIIFAAFSLYLIITVGSTTHQQLLIGTVFRLPILSVNIPILGFYIVLPLLYLIAHFNLLGELNALSDDAHRLKRHLDRTDSRLQAPIPFGLARTLVQPDDSGLPQGLIYGLFFIVIVLVPPLILLQIQLRFLPYHEQFVTWLHRGMIVVDILMIMSLWFKFRNEGLRDGTLRGNGTEETDDFWLNWAKRSLSEIKWAYRNTVDASLCSVIFITLIGFSVFIATVPNGAVERAMVNLFSGACGACVTELGDGETDVSYLGHRSETERRMLTPTFFLFERPESWRWIRRNLIVPHSDLVMRRPQDNLLMMYRENVNRLKEIWDQGVRGIDLRGRDLRFADFSHSDLRKADLRGADLEGAVFFGANLQFANFSDVERAKIGECPSHHWFHEKEKEIDGKPVTFCRTNVASVNLRQADLRGARFWDTDLQKARIGNSRLQSASFFHGRLVDADMSGANLADASLSQDDACVALGRGARFKEKADDGTDDENDEYKKLMKISCVTPFEF